MSGNIDQEKGKDNSDKMESLQCTSLAVQEMVKQMQNTNMDFEEDLQDPMERVMIVRDKPKPERPRSTEGSSRGRGRGRGRGGRSNSFCSNKSDSYQKYQGQARKRDSDTFSNGSWEEPNSSKKYQNSNYGHQGRSNQGNRYSSSNAFSRFGNSTKKPAVDVYDLVWILLDCPNFSASLLQLMEDFQMNPPSVRNLVASYDHVFELRDERVVLCPKTKICKDHTGSFGCQNQNSCQDLHICPQYVASWCQDKNCVYGHRWFTDHNKQVQERFCIDDIGADYMKRLVQSLISTFGSGRQLDICKEYNGSGCSKSDCDALHICQSFVAGRSKCTLSRCQLSHDILSMECSRLLVNHGISTNETPRDVITALVSANPHIVPSASGKNADGKIQNKQSSASASSSHSKEESASSKSNAKEHGASASRNRTRSDSSTDNDDKGDRERSSDKSKYGRSPDKGFDRSPKKRTEESKYQDTRSAQRTGKKSFTAQTIWSHEFQGDTIIAEICYYSVESKCRNEATGCHRLHSTTHYHWQVSEQGTNWLNLSKLQRDALEHAYCDVDTDEKDLPKLNPEKLEPTLKGLFSLMGRDTWKANFPAMILTNSDFSTVMYLRRLCTETVSGKNIKACKNRWYFLDKNQKWVEYGKVDTAGETNLVSSVTSDDIEKHFIQTGGKQLHFQNASYKYSIDFFRMTQKNLNTNVVREVRRRPELHMKVSRNMTSGSSKSSNAVGIPSSWDPMQPQERMRLVTLSQNSSEYQAVVNLLGGAQTNIVKIERIQNPFLYNAFQNKVKELIALYGNQQSVGVRQLFHGTKPNVISNICVENFDWRLHGTSSGQSYGRGVYFSPNSQTSLGYCSADASGNRHLFVARVAVGSITQGNSSTVRPPINPATGIPYESTGDGTNVVVKYDKQEYYPEYLITIR